jgi:hypothetical protein
MLAVIAGTIVGFALTLLTTAVSATPLVVELTRRYQPKALKVDPIALPRQIGCIPNMHSHRAVQSVC